VNKTLAQSVASSTKLIYKEIGSGKYLRLIVYFLFNRVNHNNGLELNTLNLELSLTHDNNLYVFVFCATFFLAQLSLISTILLRLKHN
jgi:hypothetical protein